MKARGRADACRMFTEPSGPLMASSATRSGWGHVREGAAPKEPPRCLHRASTDRLGGTDTSIALPNGLHIDHDGHRVANDHTAFVHYVVPTHTEVVTIDLGRR